MPKWRSLCVVVALLVAAISAGQLTQKELNARYEKLRDEFTNTAGFENWMPEGIEAALRPLNLKTRREFFEAAVPVALESSLTGAGEKFSLIPVAPRFGVGFYISTTAPLVRFGSGMRGAIVALRSNEASRAAEAFRAGAVATILELDATANRTTLDEYVVDAPTPLPQFAMTNWVVDTSGKRHKIVGGSKLERRKLTNLIVEIPGSDPKLSADPILVGAPLEDHSSFPFVTQSGSDGRSAWILEGLIRWLLRSPGRRPVHAVFFAGHELALAGERAFVAARLKSGEPQYRFAALLDLQSDEGALVGFSQGHFYRYRNEARDVVRRGSSALRAQADVIAPLYQKAAGSEIYLDAVNDSDGFPWQTLLSGPTAISAEPFILAGIPAVTFRSRMSFLGDAPLSLRPGNPWIVPTPDATTVLRSLLQLPLNQDSKERFDGRPPFIVDPKPPSRMTLTNGFARLEGKAVTYDPSKSFAPDTPVPGAAIVIPNIRADMGGVSGDIVALADENGRFSIDGLAPLSAYFILDRKPMNVFAVKTNEQGRVTMASTFGSAGGGTYETTFELAQPVKSTPLLMAPLTAAPVAPIIDPRRLSPFKELRLFDPRNDSAPQHGFAFLPSFYRPGATSSLGVVFVEPGKPFRVAAFGDGPGVRGLATAEAPSEGWSGPPLDLSSRSATEISDRTTKRYEQLKPYRMLPASLENQVQALSKSSNNQSAWADALALYPSLQAAASDVLNGALFYMLLLAPLAAFLERLAFPQRKAGARVGVTAAIFVLGFLALRAVHPAFAIVANPAMIFVAFAMAALSAMVAAFVLGKFDSQLRSLETRMGSGAIGPHRGLVAVAVALALGSMSKRRLRTALTAATFIVLTFVCLSFTSIVPEVQISRTIDDPAPKPPRIFIRTPQYDPLPDALPVGVDPTTRIATIWAYPGDPKSFGKWVLTNDGKSVDVRAAIAFEGTDAMSRQDGSLRLRGLLIRDGIRMAPETAKALGLKLGDTVQFAGMKLYYRGNISQTAQNPDGSLPTPADFPLSQGMKQASGAEGKVFRKFGHFEPKAIIEILPEAARSLDGTVRAISAAPLESKPGWEVRIAQRLDVNVYATGEFGTARLSSALGAKGEGFGLAALIILIGALFAMNALMAGVQERTREIGVLSALGMAPQSIAWVFVSEALVYATLGAVGGYFLAQGAATIALSTGSISALRLNFSATSAVSSATIVGFAALVSCIYPARLAAKLAAPAHVDNEEAETIDERTVRLRLPFSATPDEIPPIVASLGEWLRESANVASGDVVAEQVTYTANSLDAVVWIAPFDVGVSSQITLLAEPKGDTGVATFTLTIERLSGEPAHALRARKRFEIMLRQRLLGWRAAPRELAGSATVQDS